jgi:DNA mismatch repair ATPase MutS
MKMQLEIVLLILIPSLVLSIISTVRHRRKALINTLKREWGASKVARSMDVDTLESIMRYWREMRNNTNTGEQVDNITWNDLDMNAIYQALNRTQSNVGEEVLYAMLREINVSDAKLIQRNRWMQALSHNENIRLALQKQLNKLGRGHDHDTFTFLNNPRASLPAHIWIYYTLAALPLVFLVLGFLRPILFAGIGVSFLLNTIVYYRTHLIWQAEYRAIRHMAAVLHCGRRLQRHPIAEMEDGFEELDTLCANMKPISRWNGLYAMQRVSDFDFLTDYFRIALQLDMISLIRIAAFIKNNTDAISRLYALVGEIDVCIAIASVRASLEKYTTPVFVNESHVNAEKFVHPLLKEPVPNDMDWQENVLITGSNASGKSTFVKALALNAILAQSVYTCWAEGFSMPRAQVMSSMAIRDNVQGGDSYFIVEIKSLKRILSALQDDKITLCFIDEILRGTNTVERIASSSSLLRYLCTQNILCIAATHDIELTQILSVYRQMHFREEITPQGMVFPYRITEGVSMTRNAIRLLEQNKFPSQVIASANEMTALFDATGKWQ